MVTGRISWLGPTRPRGIDETLADEAAWQSHCYLDGRDGLSRRTTAAPVALRPHVTTPPEDIMASTQKFAELPGTRLECDIGTITKPIGSDAAKRSRHKRLITRGQATRAEFDLRDLYADA